MGKFIDLTGQKFGRLTAIEVAGSTPTMGVLWKCLCECNQEVFVPSGQLRSGRTKSCGCLHKDLAKHQGIKHMKFGDRIRRIRALMIGRCYNKNNIRYKNYGSRGIFVCEEWLSKKFGLLNFYNWAIENGYRDDLTIDRIDNDGPYAPWNCRWATYEQQANNTRRNKIIEYNGEIRTVSEWSKITGINRSAIVHRIERGWSIEDTLTKSVRKMKNSKKPVENLVEVVEDSNLFGEEVLSEDGI